MVRNGLKSHASLLIISMFDAMRNKNMGIGGNFCINRTAMRANFIYWNLK